MDGSLRKMNFKLKAICFSAAGYFDLSFLKKIIEISILDIIADNKVGDSKKITISRSRTSVQFTYGTHMDLCVSHANTYHFQNYNYSGVWI